MSLSKRFKLSYAGAVEYDIYDGYRKIATVETRHFANSRMDYNGDYYETGILPQVGTVRYLHHSDWLEFPSEEIAALFPGFVGQRLVFHGSGDETSVEYQYNGPAPILCAHPFVGEYVTFEWMRDYLIAEEEETQLQLAAIA